MRRSLLLLMAAGAALVAILLLRPDPDEAPSVAAPAPIAAPAPASPAAAAKQSLRAPTTVPLRYEDQTREEYLRPPPRPTPSPLRTARRYFLVLVDGGGVLRADDVVIRLADIEAPDAEETCESARGERWPCGRMSQTALQRLIRGRAVDCRPRGLDGGGALLARCEVAGTDINEWMVRQGWARAAEDSFYGESLAAARKDGNGLWRDAGR